MANRLNRQPLWLDVVVTVVIATLWTVVALLIDGDDWTFGRFATRLGTFLLVLAGIRVFARRRRAT